MAHNWHQRMGALGLFRISVIFLYTIVLTRQSIAYGNPMALTPEGIARGLTLSTFVTGFQSQGDAGRPALTYLPDGRILAINRLGQLQKFENVNGQNAASIPVLQTYSAPSIYDLTVSGGQTYLMTSHSVERIDSNSGANLGAVFSGGPFDSQYYAMDTNPANGWLLVYHWGYGVYSVNPATGQYNPPFSVGGTGMVVTPDGTHLYAASLSGHLYRSNVGGGGMFDYGAVPGNYQGTWPGYSGTCGPSDVALGFGPLAGRLYTSCVDGTIRELNLQTLAYTLIATGGSDGQRIAVDPSGNGDILITQSDRILRLSGIPEPASLSLLAIGGLVIFRRSVRTTPAQSSRKILWSPSWALPMCNSSTNCST